MLCSACGRPLSFIRRGMTVGDDLLCPDCFAEVPPEGEMARLARYYEGLSTGDLLAVLEKGTKRHRVYALKVARDEILGRGGTASDRARALFSSVPNVEYLEPLIEKQLSIETEQSGAREPDSVPGDSMPRQPEERPEPFLTTESKLGEPISERLAILSEEAAIGMRGIRDFLVGTLKSGETKSLASLDELQNAKQSVLSALRRKARAVGADDIVAVTLRYEQLGAGINMLLVVATGTAVRMTQSAQHSESQDGTGAVSVPVYRFEPDEVASNDEEI